MHQGSFACSFATGDEAQRLRRARRGQGPGADTPRWVRRTTDQMARYVEDDRAGHVYGRHVVAADPTTCARPWRRS